MYVLWSICIRTYMILRSIMHSNIIIIHMKYPHYHHHCHHYHSFLFFVIAHIRLQDDSFQDNGGLVYGIIADVTRKWVCVLFRGTVPGFDLSTRKISLDVSADLNFTLNYEPYKKVTTGSNAGSHSGFTEYLFNPRKFDIKKRPTIDRIIFCSGYEPINSTS